MKSWADLALCQQRAAAGPAGSTLQDSAGEVRGRPTGVHVTLKAGYRKWWDSRPSQGEHAAAGGRGACGSFLGFSNKDSLVYSQPRVQAVCAEGAHRGQRQLPKGHCGFWERGECRSEVKDTRDLDTKEPAVESQLQHLIFLEETV